MAELQCCDACAKPKHTDKDLLKCGRCKQAFYHDRDCQKKHWSKHKALCKKLVQLQQEQKQQEENFKILQTEDKGRVLVARKNFAPGETVLLESPAVLFDTRLEYRGLLEAFTSATAETQSKVLDLYAPPPEEIDSPARQQRHVRLEQQRQAHLPKHEKILTTAVTQKLLAIIETNAHQLFNYSQSNNPSNNNTADPKQWMGLFVLGSMLEHSCSPNLTMNTTTDGKLELIAETSIQFNDRLSFSYLEGIYEKSRAQRQAQLTEEKHFQCNCDRCRGCDDCRPMKMACPHCQRTTHPILWHATRQEYVCLTTNQPVAEEEQHIAEFIRIETELGQSMQDMEQQLETGTPFEIVLPQITQLMTSEAFTNNIHPRHWFTLSAYQFLSTTASAMARLQSPPQNASLLRVSVLALLHNITWVEELVSVLRENNSNNKSLAVLFDNDNSALQQITQILQNRLAKPSLQVRAEDMKRIVENLCSRSTTNDNVTADSLLSAFYAGQDLILAGHTDLCVVLYQRYKDWFHKFKQPNDGNRARIDAFVSSRGSINPFSNVML